MSSMFGWMIALTVSVCATILAAAFHQQFVHMGVTGVVSLVFALLAVREHNALVASGSSRSAVGASTARHAGLIWAWGAIGMLVTYALILENQYSESWQFTFGFLAAAAASLFLAMMLSKDAAADKVDNSIMKIGRLLVGLQFLAVVAALISMLVEGKFPRDTTYPDWAACNIFFFGGLAVAALSLNALLNSAQD